MTSSTALTSASLLDLKAISSPQSFAHALRERGPVFYAEADKIWVITDYSIATKVLKGSEFSADRSSFFAARASGCPFSRVANFFSVAKKMMVASDAPDHQPRRQLAAHGISDHVVQEFIPQVQKTIKMLLKRVPLSGTFDFVKDIAVPLPLIVLADLFCIPEEERSSFSKWANDMTQFFGGGSIDILREADLADHGAKNLQSFFLDLIARRRAQPAGDFISHLLREQSKFKLDDEEITSQAIMMLVAGSVTVSDQLSQNLYGFLARPELIRAVRANETLLDPAIEEFTRLDPAVTFVFRIAKSNVWIADKRIDAGEAVFISIHAANRDPSQFESPDAIDIERARNPHLSYGSGPHYCLGAKLGRIQMRLLFSSLFQLPLELTMSTTMPNKRKNQSLAFGGFETLFLVVSR